MQHVACHAYSLSWTIRSVIPAKVIELFHYLPLVLCFGSLDALPQISLIPVWT